MQKQVIEFAGEPVGIVIPDNDRLKFIAVKFHVHDLTNRSSTAPTTCASRSAIWCAAGIWPRPDAGNPLRNRCHVPVKTKARPISYPEHGVDGAL